MQLSLSEYACQDNANPSSLNSFDIILSNDMLVSFFFIIIFALTRTPVHEARLPAFYSTRAG